MKACADGEEGEKIVLKYGALTKKAGVNYSPFIDYNDVHDRNIEEGFRTDFVKTVCGLFKQKPGVCDFWMYLGVDKKI